MISRIGYSMRRIAAIALVTVSLTATVGGAQIRPIYPATRKDSTVDNYFGKRVADPYRWLEDQNSPEVAKWVSDQNAVTFAYLNFIPLRETFRQQLTALTNVPRVSTPFRIGSA